MKSTLKEIHLTFLISIFILIYCHNASAQKISIIPIPASVSSGKGDFVLKRNTIISINDEKCKNVTAYLINKLTPATGYNLKVTDSDAINSIRLELTSKTNSVIGNEGYILEISPEKVIITANTPAGLFYGVQSLLQLLPKEIESKNLVKGFEWKISSVSIVDYPRFAWRGIMLDVSRHFFSKEYIKEFIDQIARHKFNRFHLHLSDDQGWRIEIKSFPKLTSVGAWRVPRKGVWGKFDPPRPGEAATDGGFYTQEEIKEIVQYAKDQFIEVLPEIDVPGHSMAAIASYPELSCTKDTSIKVNPGSKFSNWFGNGKFEMTIDNSLNPADEKVYEFLDKVFTEIAALFPFDYIHIGGDECFKGYWEKDAGCQAFMKKNNLKNSEALQSYFTKRVVELLSKKNKKAIGWDEILEGGIAPGAAVMSWRGTKGGIEATHQKHPVVMSPSPLCYLDLQQGDPAVEPPVYAVSRLKDTYKYEPVSEGIDSSLVLGGQGNIWTEQLSLKPQVEYMMYPRALAISEIFWSPKATKNWSSFSTRVENQFKRFDQTSMNYARSMFDPIVMVTKNKTGELVVSMTTEVEGLDIHCTIDNSIPDKYHPAYKDPITFLPKNVDQLRIITYRNGEQMGKLISIKTEDLEKRAKK